LETTAPSLVFQNEEGKIYPFFGQLAIKRRNRTMTFQGIDDGKAGQSLQDLETPESI
jgi:hypothetical protein